MIKIMSKRLFQNSRRLRAAGLHGGHNSPVLVGRVPSRGVGARVFKEPLNLHRRLSS